MKAFIHKIHKKKVQIKEFCQVFYQKIIIILKIIFFYNKMKIIRVPVFNKNNKKMNNRIIFK